jgi:SAM-dependent methyltransferase
VTTAFDRALSGQPAELVRSDGGTARLDVQRWRAAAGGEDRWLLARCRGATIDLGCGPGRLLVALAARGVAALGVDIAPEAVAQCARRGVRAVHADVFSPLPDEGRWDHALLADGNLGIGGDPEALLRRAASIVAPGGTVLVELDPAEPGLWRGEARVRIRHAVTPPFPWACAGPSAVPDLAARAGFAARAYYRGVRHFVELVRGVAPMPGGGVGTDATRWSRSAGHRGRPGPRDHPDRGAATAAPREPVSSTRRSG